MVKKFQIPPSFLKFTEDSKFADPASYEGGEPFLSQQQLESEIPNRMKENGYFDVLMSVAKRIQKYMDRKPLVILEKAAHNQSADGGYLSPVDMAQEKLNNLCRFYVLKTMGITDFENMLPDGDDRMPLQDLVKIEISKLMSELAKILGKKQTDQVFRKLQNFTEEALIEKFGPRR